MRNNSFLGRSLRLITPIAVAAVFLTVGGVQRANANAIPGHVQLSDMNSTVWIDPTSQIGMHDWVVDGVTHMSPGGHDPGQWWWYSINGAPEVSINTGTVLTHNELHGPGTDFLHLIYTHAQFTAEIEYNLTGGTPGFGADIGESVRITNTSLNPIKLRFFEYTDLDLNGFPFDDTGQLVNANTWRQWDGGPALFSEVISTPPANGNEIALFPSLLAKLNDGSLTTLDGSTGPLTGDVTFAWSWDRTLARGASLVISKDKIIAPVPEPGTIALLGTGLLGMLGYYRRKGLRFWKKS